MIAECRLATEIAFCFCSIIEIVVVGYRLLDGILDQKAAKSQFLHLY